MKSAMIYPSTESESAISNYTLVLLKSITKKGFEMNSETYEAGKYKTLFKKLRKIKEYDLVHIQHEYNLLGGYGLPFFCLLFYLKFFTKSKIVLTFHTVLSKKSKFEGNILKTILRKILYHTQNRFINLTCDKIITHCYYFKNILVGEYNINSNKIEVIPQAIIEDIKTLSKSQARKELKLSGKVYLLIGSFVPDHGADIVVRQAKKIGKTILIATNPYSANDRNNERILNYLGKVKKIVKDNFLQDYIRFDLGKIPFELWWKYFSASDLVLLPYRGGIGSGIFSDAIAMKVPMVGSDIPYFQEFSKKYGIIEIAKKDNFSKAIKRAMESKNYAKMKKSFERYTKEFGVSNIGSKYKDLYLSIK